MKIDNGIICHQVNCMGKMGAGLALKIRKKWPIVYQRYFRDEIKLGSVQIIQVAPSLIVANLVGQYGYGRDKRYTNYPALMNCFIDLQKISDKLKLQIYIPYKIGCSNAGGDWEIVEKLIYETIKNPMICKYEI